MPSGFLIYGSYGYTGELIVQEALRRGLSPILAGRDRIRLQTQAASFDLPFRAFALVDPAVVDAALADVAAVIHCAGPFSQTYRAVVDSCLRTATHYLDITGEMDVLEGLHALDGGAREAGVMLLPGAGFDVVLLDCLAAHLKRRLPSATRLTLAVQAVGHPSRGTVATAVGSLHRGGLVRRNGALVPVAAASRTRDVDFGRGPVEAVTIPLGDVVTAYYSTGIPNVEVYVALPAPLRGVMAIADRLERLVGSRLVRWFLKMWVDALPVGPLEEDRAKGESRLWGEAENGSGRRVAARLRGPEIYDLTAQAAVSVMERVLGGEAPAGFQTPSLAYGADFVLGLRDVHREDVT